MELVVIKNEHSENLIQYLFSEVIREDLLAESDSRHSDDYLNMEHARVFQVKNKKRILKRINNILTEIFYENIYQEMVSYDDLIDSGETELQLLGEMLKSTLETQTQDIVLLFPLDLKGSVGMVLTHEALE